MRFATPTRDNSYLEVNKIESDLLRWIKKVVEEFGSVASWENYLTRGSYRTANWPSFGDKSEKENLIRNHSRMFLDKSSN